jgi:hypothetical protein
VGLEDEVLYNLMAKASSHLSNVVLDRTTHICSLAFPLKVNVESYEILSLFLDRYEETGDDRIGI